jgi:hypothetical protein
MQKIKKGEADWSALCQPLGFFNLHKRYLQLLIKVKDAGDLWMWKLKVEPLWMELPLKVFYMFHSTCHSNFEICFTMYVLPCRVRFLASVV